MELGLNRMDEPKVRPVLVCPTTDLNGEPIRQPVIDDNLSQSGSAGEVRPIW